MTTRPGAARELPGLQGFEDEDEESDLSNLLSKRKRAPGQAPDAAAAAPSDADNSSSPPASPKTPSPPKKRNPRKAPTATRASTTPPPTTNSERANRIRSTVVHIPTPLVAQVATYREANGLSNGNVVIRAIEFAYPHLSDLIEPPGRAGGGLFRERVTRQVRTTEGPLTPLNVRLFEDDIAQIDKLVGEFGAFSRGHLITASLTDFFAQHD